jgi:uncharacterized protein
MKLTLFVNHACNLRCVYCYTGAKFNKPMPLDVAQAAIDLGLRETQARYLLLSFFGGEPMLEVELMELAVRYARRRTEEEGAQLFTAIATNGTLLDRRRLELLTRSRFQVQVSLDGCAAAQDATRRFRNGRSSYARIERNLRRLLEEGFDPRVVAVVDPANARYMAESFDSLTELGVRRIHFSPNYNGGWDDPSCERFEAALRELGDRLMARFRGGQDVRLDPLNGKIVTHLNRGYQKNDLCKFGQAEIAVSPRGYIYPCDRLVAEDSNVAIRIGDAFSGIDVARRDAMVGAKNEPDPECAACELRPRCMHWCGCANYETTGDVAQVSPIVCWFERCFIAEADRVANTMYAERDPVFIRRFYAPELPLPTPKADPSEEPDPRRETA